LGGELGREGVMVKVGDTFGIVVCVVVVVVVIVELLVGVDEEPKRLGPFTAAKGDPAFAYARKPPPLYVHISVRKT
jgi:hypothetical protein